MPSEEGWVKRSEMSFDCNSCKGSYLGLTFTYDSCLDVKLHSLLWFVTADAHKAKPRKAEVAPRVPSQLFEYGTARPSCSVCTVPMSVNKILCSLFALGGGHIGIYAGMNQNSRHQKEVDVGVNGSICSHFKDNRTRSAVLRRLGCFLLSQVPENCSEPSS